MFAFFSKYKFSAFLLIVVVFTGTAAAKTDQSFYSRFFTLTTHREGVWSSKTAITLDDQFAYISNANKLMRFDLADTSAPYPDAQLFFDTSIAEIVLNNGRLYIVIQYNFSSSLIIFDPTTFQVLSKLDDIGYLYNGIAILGNKAYISVGGKLNVIDITDAYKPFSIKSISGSTKILAYDESRIISFDYGDDPKYWIFQFWSLQYPDTPILINTYSFPSQGNDFIDAILRGSKLYILSEKLLGCGIGACAYEYYWHQINISNVTRLVEESKTKLSEIPYQDSPLSISVQDDILYVGTTNDDIIIYTTTNLQQPSYSNTIPGPTSSASFNLLATTQNKLLAYSRSGLRFYNRATASLLRVYDTPWLGGDLAWEDGFVLAGTTAVDITQPGKVTRLFDFDSLFSGSNDFLGSQTNGRYAYFVFYNLDTGENRLYIFDMIDPTQPTLLTNYLIPLPQPTAADVKIVVGGDNLYLVWRSGLEYTSINIINISNLTQPATYDSFSINSAPQGQVIYYQNTLYMRTSYLLAFDVSDPMHIREIQTNVSLASFYDPAPFAIFDQRLYAGTNPMNIYDLTNPTEPQLVETVNLDHNLSAIAVGNTDMYLLTQRTAEKQAKLFAFDPHTLTITGVHFKPYVDGALYSHNNQLIISGYLGLYLFDVHTTNTTLFLPIAADHHPRQ